MANRSRIPGQIFALGVALVGAFLLTWVSRGAVPLSLHSPSQLIVWMSILSIAAMSAIPLPRGGTAVSVTPVLDLAAILVFGPAVAGRADRSDSRSAREVFEMGERNARSRGQQRFLLLAVELEGQGVITHHGGW